MTRSTRPHACRTLGQFVNPACPLPHVRRYDILGTSARSSPIPLLKTGNKQTALDRSLRTVRAPKMRKRMPVRRPQAPHYLSHQCLCESCPAFGVKVVSVKVIFRFLEKIERLFWKRQKRSLRYQVLNNDSRFAESTLVVVPWSIAFPIETALPSSSG